MARHNALGKWGEQLAAQYLASIGYAIVETNWRCGHYETDIIAMYGGRVIFVEVKTRSTDFCDPVAAVDLKRRRHLEVSADAYIKSHGIPHEYQFDIITIIGDEQSPQQVKLTHIPDAFVAKMRTSRL